MSADARAKPAIRRGLLFWLGRVAAGLGILLVALVVAGLAYQSIASARDRAAFPPPGRLVDIGGFRLHIYCTGAARPGWPTVILESGLGEPLPIWQIVQGEVSATTRVCSYDRAGVGWSEPSPNRRDAVHIAAELHALLGKAGIAPPLVLAAHSSGGLYVRAFQRLYPAEVLGMVLIDTTPEGFAYTNTHTMADRVSISRQLAFAPLLAQLGIVRFFSLCNGLPKNFPARHAAAFVALCEASDAWPAERDEYQTMPEPLPRGAPLSIPLVVLTSGVNVAQLSAWGGLQDKIATLSSDSIHIVVAKAAHASFMVDAKTAHLTSALIGRVVTAAATHTKLHAAKGD